MHLGHHISSAYTYHDIVVCNHTIQSCWDDVSSRTRTGCKGGPSDVKLLVLPEGLVIGRGDVRLALRVAELGQHMLKCLEAEEVLILHCIPEVNVPATM